MGNGFCFGRKEMGLQQQGSDNDALRFLDFL
jgi:hypothetical protein